MSTEIKIIDGKRYHRYEYHGRKTMTKSEADEGIKWFRSKFSRNFSGKIVATIRKIKETNGLYSLWHRDKIYERK